MPEGLLDAAPAREQSGDGSSQNSQPKNESSQPNSSPQGADWKTHIPEALRGEKTWDKYKDVGSALQSLHHLEKKIGSSVSVPTEKSTPEETAAFYEKLGVPKDSKGYTFTEPKLPDGIVWEKEGLTAFTDVAHKLHLTPAQVQGVLDYYGQAIGSKYQGTAEARTATETELKKEWGQGYDERLGEVHAALKSYDGKGEFKALLKEAGLDNDPRTLRFLQSIGSETREHSHVNGERQEQMTKEDAQRKVDEIQKAGPDHPLYNKKDPKHKDAVNEYRELLTAANS